MTSKFEKLSALVVNGQVDEASELFHEICVEKSREILESLMHDDEDMEEGDSCAMDEADDLGGDPTDGMVDDVTDHDASDSVDGDHFDDMDDHSDAHVDDLGMDDEHGSDEPATKDDILDVKDALSQLQAEFDELMKGEMKEPEHQDMKMDMEDDAADENGDESDEGPETPKTESRKIREYVDKVKTPANKEESGVNTKSTVSSAKGRPTTDADAKNIVKGSAEEKGSAAPKAKDMGIDFQNKPGSDAGKNFYKKAAPVTKKEAPGTNTRSLEQGKK